MILQILPFFFAFALLNLFKFFFFHTFWMSLRVFYNKRLYYFDQKIGIIKLSSGFYCARYVGMGGVYPIGALSGYFDY